MKSIAIFLINLYQVYLSPLKNYRCAYSVKTGRAGCSEAGKRYIRFYGFIGGIKVLRKRFNKCAEAYHSLEKKNNRRICTCDNCSSVGDYSFCCHFLDTVGSEK